MSKLKINLGKHDRHYAKIWLTVFDGGSDQWLYVVRDGLTYIFLEIDDMVSACGRDADRQWCATVATVDLAAADDDTIASALQCCGHDGEIDLRDEGDRLALAEMLFSYGAKSPMWEDTAGPVTFDSYGNCEQDYSDGGRYFRSLRKQAREAAEELFDGEERDRQLDARIVNAIGQTAREFAGGTSSLWDALRRIKADPNATDDQKLVLKMYGSCEQTLGAGPIPGDIRS